MADDGIYLTEEGLEKLRAELDRLIKVDRKEVAERIRQTKHFNESVEDLDFEDAKNQQAFVESRIAELQVLMQRAEIVTRDQIPTRYVGIGSVVDLYNLDTKEKVTYRIVGALEAEPMDGLISYTSPVGQALMGCSKGEEVEVEVPAGLLRYRIERIRKPPRKRSSTGSGSKGTSAKKTSARTASSRSAASKKKTKTKTKSSAKAKTKPRKSSTRSGSKTKTKGTASRSARSSRKR